MVGVCPPSVSVCVFTDSAGAGVEEAEELAKATGVCMSVRARPAGVCGQSTVGHLRELHGWTAVKNRAEDRRKAGVGRTDLTPVDSLFLRRAVERVTRCSSQNILGCVSTSLFKSPRCLHFDMQSKSRIVPVVSFDELPAKFDNK